MNTNPVVSPINEYSITDFHTFTLLCIQEYGHESTLPIKGNLVTDDQIQMWIHENPSGRVFTKTVERLCHQIAKTLTLLPRNLSGEHLWDDPSKHQD